MPDEKPTTLPFASKAGYGLGDLGFLLVWHGTALFLLYFYTDILGIKPGLAGAIYLIAMIWDAVLDPVVAAWAERHAMRKGRYAGIISWAALPVGMGYVLLFLMPPLSGTALVVWALFAHLAFRTAYTFASMPYNTLPVRLSTQARDRNALSGFRVAGAATGAIITAVLTPLVVVAAQEQQQSEAAGYLFAAVIIGGLAAMLLWACSRIVKESEGPRATPGAANYASAVIRMFRAASANRPLQYMLAVLVFATIGSGLFTHTILFFAIHVLARPDAVTALLGLSALATILAAPLWVFFASRTSKKVALMSGLILAGFGYGLLAFAQQGGITLPLIAVVITGGGGAAIPVMLWSIVPDTIEYGEAHSGERIEARTFGLATFAQKTAMGLTALLAGGLLSLSGYQGGETPDANALSAMSALVSWLPAAFMIAVALIIARYPVTEAMHRQILAELASRKTEGP